MIKFKPFGKASTATEHVYTSDGCVDFNVEKIVALLDGRVVDAIDNPKMDMLYFLVDVIFTDCHAHYLLVDRDCLKWHEVVPATGSPGKFLLKDDDELCFDNQDRGVIQSAIESYCSGDEK